MPRTVNTVALASPLPRRPRAGTVIRRALHGIWRSARGVKVPHWTEVPDHFVWKAFAELSNDNRLHLEPHASQQEALLAHTHDFYVIPDQFGVVNGHLLILPKRSVRSIAALGPEFDDEIGWLLERVSKVVADAYGAHVVIAEHGECGCATNDQAHVHVVPIPATVEKEDLTKVIDGVLARRMAGIERIAYLNAEFTALDDLRDLLDVKGAEVIGAQLRSTDLTMSGVYPAAAREMTGLARPYVYFNGPGVEFLSMRSFRSQFVREVVARVTGLSDGSWDRRARPDRGNMFATFEALAPAFAQWPDGDHGFRVRAAPHGAPRPASPVPAKGPRPG